MSDERLRIGLLWLAALAGAAMSLWVVGATLAQGVFRPDFTVFWTAARFWFERPADLYDVAAITQAQASIVGPEAARPWVYPPSFLPWLAPLGLLPVWPAMGLWCVVTALLFGLAGWTLTRSPRAVALAFAAPSMAMALISGQAAMLIGALVMSGCAVLQRRPWVAGLLFGLAATIKPQAVALVPLALIVGRQWAALRSAVFTGLAVGVASVAAGPGLWLDWLASLEEFTEIAAAMDLTKRSLGGTGLVAALGLEGPAATSVAVAAGALGVALVAICWWRSEDLRIRAASLLCGGLLVSPYAMGYDGAALAVLGFALLLDRSLSPRLWAAGLFLTMTGNAIVTAGAALLMLSGSVGALSAAWKPAAGR